MAFFVEVYFFISSCSWEQVAGSYQKNDCSVIASWGSIIFISYTLFFYKNIFYKNIETEICEILRIFYE